MDYQWGNTYQTTITLTGYLVFSKMAILIMYYFNIGSNFRGELEISSVFTSKICDDFLFHVEQSHILNVKDQLIE